MRVPGANDESPRLYALHGRAGTTVMRGVFFVGVGMEEIEIMKLLADRVDYDPATGALVWKFRDIETSTDKMFNTRFAGKECGAVDKSHGYRITGFKYNGKLWSVRSHRLCFFIGNGFLPKQVDHINHNRTDNRLSNLSAATNKTNHRNRTLNKNNTTGFCGVSYHKKMKKYVARSRGANGIAWIGQFSTASEAAIAVKEFREKSGYHPNHGMPK